MISYYPPVEGAVISYEHSSHASQRLGVPGQSAPREEVLHSSSGKSLEVTTEEEEAWGEKLQRLAGCVA